MKRIYCDYKWKNNLIAGFFKTWKEGDSWWDYNKDRSIIGYIVLAIMFPLICVLAIPFTIFELLLSFKVSK